MAVTIHTLLERIDDRFKAPERVERKWAYPFLRLVVASPAFTGLDDDEREEAFATRLDLTVAQLRALSARGFVQWDLVSPSDNERLPLTQKGTGWIDLLDPKFLERHASKPIAGGPPHFVHFYGFKGGQGRSTILALLAYTLAENGWRVLAVDFDAEAPSLDVVFSARTTDLAATVVGLRAEQPFRPSGLGRTAKGGEVALLAFRPDGNGYDLDAAALAFELQAHPPAAELLAEVLQKRTKDYDVVLIDHRTGLGPVVPLLVQSLPGPVVVCARLDGQSRHARQAIGALWAVPTGWPGALVSLSHPEESEEEFRERTRSEAEDLLQGLARMHGSVDDDEPSNAQEFEDHWVVWPFDPMLARSPKVRDAWTNIHRNQLADLRRLLNLEEIKHHELRKSGATDEGELITTNALRKLQTPSSPITLILGRKGTGKTRLLRALAEQRLGEPLLVPTDFPKGLLGVPASHLKLKKLIERFRSKPEFFWYSLLIAALESADTQPDHLLDKALGFPVDYEFILARLSASVGAVQDRRTFLVDGLESAFSHEDTFPFIRGLFRVVEAVEGTPELASALQLRLFVRRDLVEKGIQNREQLESGRRIDLVWDTQTIFNFALARIVRIDAFPDVFPVVARKIVERIQEIREGGVPQTECEALLLEIFPPRLSYKNMATLTFLRTYFSDDSEGKASFYPRVYLLFLEGIAKTLRPKSLVRGRVDGRVVVRAHQAAAEAFLDEVSQELAFASAVDLPTLKRVLEQLEGRKTPFDVDELVGSVAKGAKLEAGMIRELFNVMKQLGIFEDYPKRPNQWRPGRLLKSALKMRFLAGGG